MPVRSTLMRTALMPMVADRDVIEPGADFGFAFDEGFMSGIGKTGGYCLAEKETALQKLSQKEFVA
jgi:hypothetical protein